MSSRGILYGLGMGPGDPDLVTVGAARILGEVDVVLAASSTKNDYSRSLEIARPYLKDGARIEVLGFPMTSDKELLGQAWDENAKKVLALLDQGLSAAFLTLGDPLLYSTFGYLMQTLQNLPEETDIRVIPGVTSFQAAAARTRTILAESGENLVILPGINGQDRLRFMLDSADNVVVLKAYRKFPAIRRAMEEAGIADHAKFVTRLGMNDEEIYERLGDVPEKTHYLSLILGPNKRN